MTLAQFWFILIAVLWTGFFVLEGFDLGVGMLHSVIGRDEPGRRAVINTIGPLWDGNEVWLIVAGAAIFAAFPGWYATWFSALYLALVQAGGGYGPGCCPAGACSSPCSSASPSATC
jgi:cytochrome d ubiquinol oxidase subunit II